MSVYRRGNVYWYEFWFRGQRIRESTGLTNKVAAQQAESIRKAGLAEGRAGIAGPRPIITFGDFVRNEFLPWAEKQYQAHPRTYERYRESTKPLLTSFEKLRLEAVSMALVEKFKVSRSSDVMPATANRDLAALRLILNLAIRKEYIAVAGPGLPDVPPGSIEQFTPRRKARREIPGVRRSTRQSARRMATAPSRLLALGTSLVPVRDRG